MKSLLNICLILVGIGSKGFHGQEIPFNLDQNDHQVQNDAEALQYLCDYGYCGSSTGETQSIIHADQLKEYFERFQTAFGLEVTGDLSEETKALMSAPRCGYPDVGPEGFLGKRKKRFTRINGPTWPVNRVIRWFIENGNDDGLSRSEVENEIRRAFQHWDEVSGITLGSAFSATSADIRISFQKRDHLNDGNTFDGPDGTLAHAFGPGSGIGGDIHFDDDEQYRIGSGVDLHQVATHEIGHSLGLAHSGDRNAIMAPFYNFRSSFELHSDDVAGIRDIYGPQPQTPPRMTVPPAAPTTEAPPPPPPPTPPQDPFYCSTRIDAVANSFDGGLYFFQGVNIYKVRESGNGFTLDDGYPKYIWEEFDRVYTGNVDSAVLFRYSSGYRILFIFRGDLYWRIDNGIPVEGYPRSITQNWGGIPANLDSAFFWTGNSYLYFFKDDQYYRYSFSRQGLDFGYPRPQSIWSNVEDVVDAVDYRGTTYFFQEQTYQQFIDRFFVAANPFPTASRWFGCQVQNIEVDVGTTEVMSTDDVTEDDATCGSSRITNHSLMAIFTALIVAVVTGRL